MSNEHECYICHRKLDLYTRWHDGKPICDNCLIGLIYLQEIEQKDQKIAELEAHIKDMEQEQIAEMKEHKEFAKQAKSKITELEKTIELIYEYEKERCHPSRWIYNVSKEEYINYFKEQAKKELENG